TPPARIGVRRDIRAAPPKAQPQRCARAHHSYLLKEITRLRSHDSSGGVRVFPSISTGTGRRNNCKIIGAISIKRGPSIPRLPGRPPLAGRKRKIPFSAWLAPSGPVSFSKVCIFPPPTVPTERQ